MLHLKSCRVQWLEGEWFSKYTAVETASAEGSLVSRSMDQAVSTKVLFRCSAIPFVVVSLVL